jgi:Domain of unknown function (DUF4034)
MNPGRWVGYAACVAVGLFLPGCDRNQSAKKNFPAVARLSRLDWNLKTTLEAYNQVGSTDPGWNDFARTALTEFARSRAGAVEPGENAYIIISTNCIAAVNAGCDDPMVRYLYIKYGMDQHESRQKFAEALCDVAQAMKKSSYPPIRKFYASARAVEQMFYAGQNQTDPSILNEWINDMEDQTRTLLADPSTPPEEISEACSVALYQIGGNPSAYKVFYDEIQKPLFQYWPDAAGSWLLKGEAYIKFAWDARGSGYVDSVTEEGWKLFAKDLNIADEALNHAWKLDPTNIRIPQEMMRVALGQDKGRDQMELWFDRAMALDPNDYEICSSKLYYLEPKWHGSAQDMLDFGRDCVQSTNWGGRVPLILVDAHYKLCTGYTDKTAQTNYWKQPEVWNDIKSAYEKFFRINPNVTGDYVSYYAHYAYLAEDWDKFNELIPKLNANDYYAFGSKEDFENALAQAKLHTASHR